jgi:uncharacterized membrane protein
MGLTRSTRNHWRHHSRFYLSALLGLIASGASWTLDQQLRLVLAGNVFYVAYLTSMGILADRLGAAELRKRAAVEDEGILLIVLLTLAAIGFSVVSLFGIVDQKSKADALLLALSIASVPLGWFTLHLILAFRYAHLYYTKARGRKSDDAGGLKFPDTNEPRGWDFIYHSFVVGTTAQVSDVDTTSTQMRKLTFIHSVVAFFYNTVLIALAVNIAVQSNTSQ